MCGPDPLRGQVHIVAAASLSKTIREVFDYFSTHLVDTTAPRLLSLLAASDTSHPSAM